MDTRTDERRRNRPLLWVSGACAASILVLGATGTLSSWTQAIINNNNNTVGSANAVALSETGPGGLCVDTATVLDGSNTATCTTVNKYGGASAVNSPDTTPLSPGDDRDFTVTLENTGAGDASTLVLTAGSCTNVSNADGTSVAPTSGNLCDYITVSVVCTSPATLTSPTSPVALSSFTGATIDSAGLASGETTDCTFTVALPANAPTSVSGQLAKQTLTWTLTA